MLNLATLRSYEWYITYTVLDIAPLIIDLTTLQSHEWYTTYTVLDIAPLVINFATTLNYISISQNQGTWTPFGPSQRTMETLSTGTPSWHGLRREELSCPLMLPSLSGSEDTGSSSILIIAWSKWMILLLWMTFLFCF